jgi:hypothetical protein
MIHDYCIISEDAWFGEKRGRHPGAANRERVVMLKKLPTNPSYIIGAGPNGVDWYDKIPRRCFRVALNGAAIDHPWTARMFCDQNCYRYDYFYKRRQGEMRIGPKSCGDDFHEYVHPQYLTPRSYGSGHDTEVVEIMEL